MRSPSARALANAALDAQLAIIHRDSRKSYGRPRITQQLRQQGQCVSAERVRRSLRRQGLRAVYRRAYVMTTDSVHRLPVAANILDRRFDGWQPNRAWVADMIYVVTGEGWLYLAAVMDLASRRIVGWSMSESIDGMRSIDYAFVERAMSCEATCPCRATWTCRDDRAVRRVEKPVGCGTQE